MKKTVLAITMIAGIFFASCSSDDGDQDPVVGKWQQTEISDGLDVTACVFNETLEFTSDGKLTLTQFESTSNNDTDNCDRATTTNYNWSVEATGTYKINQSTQTYTVTIFVINNELELTTSEIFIPEGAEVSQIKKTYKRV